ncbi:MAG: hypothetical protein H6608_12050 [Flavobacteriales bacterium]|nr:hypothetical protein [Bacteroidota bacterium]MCB9241862.1 hypothetical protein [Flavobacteriales bacterium]
MINNILKIVLSIAAVFLAYMVYDSIASEMRYRDEVEEVEAQVIKKLEDIRLAQLTYKEEKGKFTNDFDTLIDYLKHGRIKVVVQYGDRDDSTTNFREEVSYVAILDTLFKDINIDSLAFVPPYDTARFLMDAMMITQGNVEVPVFKVEDPHPFDKKRRNPNDPKKPLQVGSLSEATYSGNWK